MLLHEKYAHLERTEDLLPLSFQIVRFKIAALRRKAARRGEYTQVSVTDIPLPDLDANPADYLERKEMLERLSSRRGAIGRTLPRVDPSEASREVVSRKFSRRWERQPSIRFTLGTTGAAST